jgi:Mg-chelatase subunit ChlD
MGTAGKSGLTGPGFTGDNPNGIMEIAGTGALGASGNGPPKAEDCGSGDFVGGRVTPIVWLVIDGSGSMADPLMASTDPNMPAAGPSRWDALRPALMDPNGGVVKTLDPLVKFGMVMFDGPLNGGPGTLTTLPDGGPATGMPPTDECPRLAVIEPALNNFSVLDMMIPMLPPGGSTPTHKAMAQVLSHLPATAPAPDQVVDPVYVVLATDGAPNDFCEGGGFNPFQTGPDPIQQMVVSLTGQMQMRGVPVYVISLAANDQRLATHLGEVATAGGTGKPPFTPQSKDALVQTFMDIIGPEVLCSVKLTKGWGIMPAVACMGSVELNGKKLECNSENGWKLSDPKTIEITGTACEEFKKTSNVRLTAFFPCEIQVAM